MGLSFTTLPDGLIWNTLRFLLQHLYSFEHSINVSQKVMSVISSNFELFPREDSVLGAFSDWFECYALDSKHSDSGAVPKPRIDTYFSKNRPIIFYKGLMFKL